MMATSTSMTTATASGERLLLNDEPELLLVGCWVGAFEGDCAPVSSTTNANTAKQNEVRMSAGDTEEDVELRPSCFI